MPVLLCLLLRVVLLGGPGCLCHEYSFISLSKWCSVPWVPRVCSEESDPRGPVSQGAQTHYVLDTHTHRAHKYPHKQGPRMHTPTLDATGDNYSFVTLILFRLCKILRGFKGPGWVTGSDWMLPKQLFVSQMRTWIWESHLTCFSDHRQTWNSTSRIWNLMIRTYSMVYSYVYLSGLRKGLRFSPLFHL